MARARLSGRERNLAVITITVIGAVLGYLFVVEPLVSQLQQIHGQFLTASSRLEKQRRLLDQRDRLKREFRALSSQMAMAASGKGEMASFLQDLERIGVQAQLVVKGLKPKPDRREGAFRKFIVDVSTEGQVDQVARFLYELQRFPYLVRVERMQLAVERGPSNRLEARWTLSTLRLASSR